jgi:hypothetical protein
VCAGRLRGRIPVLPLNNLPSGGDRNSRAGIPGNYSNLLRFVCLLIYNDEENKTLIIKHDKLTISDAIKTWLKQFKEIENFF